MKLKLIRFIGKLLYKMGISKLIGFTQANQFQPTNEMPRKRRWYALYILKPFYERFINEY